MYKNGTVKRDNQTFRRKSHQNNLRKKVSEIEKEHQDRPEFRIGKEKAQQGKKNIPYDLGTIPPINVSVPVIRKSGLPLDLLDHRMGTSSLKYLQFMSSIFGETDFEMSNDINSVVYQVMNYAEQFTNMDFKLYEDHITATCQVQVFGGYYLFDLNFFALNYQRNLKVLYPAIHSICAHINAGMHDFGSGWMDDLDENEEYEIENADTEEEKQETIRYFSNKKDAFKEAEQFNQEFWKIVNLFEFDIVKDKDWLVEYLYYSGLQRMIDPFLNIIKILEAFPNLCIDEIEEETLLGEASVYHCFTWLDENYHEEFITMMLDEMAGNSGLTAENTFKLDGKEKVYLSSSITAIYIREIFDNLHSIIYESIK